MVKKGLTIMAIVSVAVMFAVTGVYAGTVVPDIIKMENKAYKKHKKGSVMFTHKQHAEKYGIACGECHHDENNKPRNVKWGDEVKNCIECHAKPSRKPKGKLSKKEELEYHAEAIHDNCIGCHKAIKKKDKKSKIPTSCAKCHPKK